jgi:hypothetical protein
MPMEATLISKLEKKSGVGFNHVSPASCQWVSLKTKKKNKKRKQTKEKNRTITTHRTF